MGEGSKRLNAVPRREGDMTKSHRGKEASQPHKVRERVVSDRDRLTASTKATEAKKLGGSTGAQGLGQSQRRSQGSFGKGSEGGQMLSKGKAAWR